MGQDHFICSIVKNTDIPSDDVVTVALLLALLRKRRVSPDTKLSKTVADDILGAATAAEPVGMKVVEISVLETRSPMNANERILVLATP